MLRERTDDLVGGLHEGQAVHLPAPQGTLLGNGGLPRQPTLLERLDPSLKFLPLLLLAALLLLPRPEPGELQLCLAYL